MRLRIKKTFFVSSGVVCFSIGALGLILPVIPGILFIALGVYLISKVYPIAARKLSEWGSRLPLVGPSIKKYL